MFHFQSSQSEMVVYLSLVVFQRWITYTCVLCALYPGIKHCNSWLPLWESRATTIGFCSNPIIHVDKIFSCGQQAALDCQRSVSLRVHKSQAASRMKACLGRLGILADRFLNVSGLFFQDRLSSTGARKDDVCLCQALNSSPFVAI